MADAIDDEYLQDDEHLKPEERWARHRLHRLIGPTRVTDQPGAPPGRHDLEADLPDGTIAAIEITSETNAPRRSLSAAVQRHLSGLRLPGSRYLWLIGLSAEADARALRHADLTGLLTDMEQQGRLSATAHGDYRDPLRARLAALGIESVHGQPARPQRQGLVYTTPGVYGGWGWAQPAIDSWITDLVSSDLGKNKLDKLAKTVHAAEHHLAVVLDPFTPAGIGISLALTDPQGPAADDMPSAAPPAPLTHLWLMPPMFTSTAFRWTRTSGWTAAKL